MDHRIAFFLCSYRKEIEKKKKEIRHVCPAATLPLWSRVQNRLEVVVFFSSDRPSTNGNVLTLFGRGGGGGAEIARADFES